MRTSRGSWWVAGLVAGFAGLAASYCVAMAMTTRDAPLTAVASGVARLTPGPVVERAIQILGHWDKPFLLLMILLLSAVVFAWAGRLARRSWWAPLIVFVLLALIGLVAVRAQRATTTVDLLPVAVGLATWLVCLPLLAGPLRRRERAFAETGAASPGEPVGHTRRGFLLRAGLIVAASAVAGVVGRAVGTGRRHVEEARRLLRLPGVTEPQAPAGVRVGLDGLTPWVTPAGDF